MTMAKFREYKCKDCDHYGKIDADKGTCRVNGPFPGAAPEFTAIFPTVLKGDVSCSKFEPELKPDRLPV